jgi:hypothetical protein
MFLGVGRGFPHGAHLFLLSIDAQAGLMLQVVAVARNGAKFSQCSVTWGGFPRAKGSGY